MPKSVLPKAESEQASARVTVEMRSVLREGRSPFMWLLRPICGRPVEQLAKRVSHGRRATWTAMDKNNNITKEDSSPARSTPSTRPCSAR